jgi:uncharacterized protein involved in cysteine biosynthesis
MPRRGFVWRLASGAMRVPAGFLFLARTPSLWPLFVLPAFLALVLLVAGLRLGLFLGPWVEAHLGPAPESTAPWVVGLSAVLLRLATVGVSMALGFGLALALTAPVLEQVSRRVEAKVRGESVDQGRGLGFEAREAAIGGLYFLGAAALAFLIGLIPIAGPPLAALWAAYALAFQLTDPALTRRGLSFREKRAWHRAHRAESEGFGLAGLVAMLVPFANLFLGPAMAAGGTLLVLDAEARERR